MKNIKLGKREEIECILWSTGLLIKNKYMWVG